MTGGQGDEPEETMPFTHRPYDADEPENPFTSPSGSSSQPSGPGYVPPAAPPPPMASPPYGPPQTGPAEQPAGWGTAWTPAYGPLLPGTQEHKGASTAMVLGIIAMVSMVVSLFCCVTLPGVLCAPFAWVKGARAKREIDASPGVYGNRGQAAAGVVMGIIGSVVGLLLVLAFVGVAVLIGSGWSLV